VIYFEKVEGRKEEINATLTPIIRAFKYSIYYIVNLAVAISEKLRIYQNTILIMESTNNYTITAFAIAILKQLLW
jgi:hypothetical protein